MQRQAPDCTLDATSGIAIIHHGGGGRSDLIISPRPHGGLTITQGPSYVLLSADEIPQLMNTIAAIAATSSKEPTEP